MSETRRGRGRPRRQGADEEILQIARALLMERGYRDLTVDALADRVGVAKTTIYRRWPSKGVLVAAALTPDGPLSNDADQLLADTISLLAPLADAADDAEILGLVRAILAPRRTALTKLLGDETRANELLGAVWMRLFVAQ